MNKRSESASSVRSSKSVSFKTSSSESSETDTDEWSGDEDPGYTKIPVDGKDNYQLDYQLMNFLSDFFKYSDEEDFANGHTANPSSYDFNHRIEYMENKHFEEPTEEKPFDEWQPATQEEPFTQENLTQELFPESASQDTVVPGSLNDVQNESYGQEEFEVEKLNEILRDHIQLQKDEFYQESFASPQTWDKNEMHVPPSPSYSERNEILSPPEEYDTLQEIREVFGIEDGMENHKEELVTNQHISASDTNTDSIASVGYPDVSVASTSSSPASYSPPHSQYESFPLEVGIHCVEVLIYDE